MALAEIRRHNETVLADLERGDLIEINRGMYNHWAVYDGDGKVIHLTGDESVPKDRNLKSNVSLFTICGETFSKAVVKVDDFWEVVSNSKAHKNNKDWMRAFSPDVIVTKARSMLGTIEYNLLWNNCEHFASWCRYGKTKSSQVEKFWILFILGLTGLTTGLLAWFWRSEEPEQKKNERKK